MNNTTNTCNPSSIRNKTDLILTLNQAAEDKTFWSQAETAQIARHGEAKVLRNVKREIPVPDSMIRVLKALRRMHALDKTGTEFKERPECFDDLGFREYFMADLMQLTGITATRTLSRALSWWEQAGVIQRACKIKDAATGQWAYARLRFHPDVLLRWVDLAFRVGKQVKEIIKTKVKSMLSGKSPSAIDGRPYSYSSSSKVESAVPVQSTAVAEERIIHRDRVNSPSSEKDRELENVLSILTEQYPDVKNLNQEQRRKVHCLTNCIFPRHRLTADKARTLVNCKRNDDEAGMEFLEGFARFDNFMELLPYWKSHVTRILRRHQLFKFSCKVDAVRSYIRSAAHALFEADNALQLQPVRNFVKAVQAGQPVGPLVQAARKLVIDDPVAYATLTGRIPQASRLLGISHYDNERLMNSFRTTTRKLGIWDNICGYAGF